MRWDVAVPVGAETLAWDVNARSADGAASDHLKVSEAVKPCDRRTRSPEPTTRSLTVEDTSTSSGSARAPTRAPIATARPATSSPFDSISPVCRPARICTPVRLMD